MAKEINEAITREMKEKEINFFQFKFVVSGNKFLGEQINIERMKINYRIMITLNAKLKLRNFFITFTAFDAKQLTGGFCGGFLYRSVACKSF